MLATVLSMMRYVSEIDDRDFVDRLHSYFTTNMLIGLSVLVSFKQFGGKPVECLTPDIFSGSWEEYAENYCWAQDTYFVPPNKVVDGMPILERKMRRISYYQWVPFFLLIEAACFRLPSLLWKCLSGHSGIKIREIIKLSSDPNNIKPEIKRNNIKSLTVHLQGALRFHRRLKRKQILPHTMLRLFNLPYSASFVTCMYLFTKFAYLCNVMFQLIILNNFLQTDRYSLYGFGALVDLLNGATWEQSGMFPRVSLCDFEVRVMGNVQQYTIQCVLVINIFNEKLFVFLWFWYVCLLIFTLGSFLFWLSVFIFPWPNRRFIERHLEMSEIAFDPEENEKAVDRFVDSYLRSDGVLVIRMLTLSAGIIFGTELVVSLWQSYYGGEQELKRSNSLPDSDLPRGDNLEHVFDAETGKNLRRRVLPPRSEAAGGRGILVHELMERLVPPPSPPSSMIRALKAAETSTGPTSEHTANTSPHIAPGSPLGTSQGEHRKDSDGQRSGVNRTAGPNDETSPVSKLEFHLGAIDEEELNQLSHSSGRDSAWTTARTIPNQNANDNVPSNRSDMSNTNSVPLRFTPKKSELENLPENRQQPNKTLSSRTVSSSAPSSGRPKEMPSNKSKG
ncbi:innexin domain-containing protein [Ditylenchus destructor]|nr:innexin domain-containing protein [Ditylenchus destructor]